MRGPKIMQVSILRLEIRDVSNGVIRVVEVARFSRIVDPKVALNF